MAAVDPCGFSSPLLTSIQRQEFGLPRNRPDASLLLRARWIAETWRRLGAANKRSNRNDRQEIRVEDVRARTMARYGQANIKKPV